MYYFARLSVACPYFNGCSHVVPRNRVPEISGDVKMSSIETQVPRMHELKVE